MFGLLPNKIKLFTLLKIGHIVICNGSASAENISLFSCKGNNMLYPLASWGEGQDMWLPSEKGSSKGGGLRAAWQWYQLAQGFCQSCWVAWPEPGSQQSSGLPMLAGMGQGETEIFTELQYPKTRGGRVV